MGAHTGSLGAMATSLREHWFKEYLADSNTPGNISLRPRVTARPCDAAALRQNNFSCPASAWSIAACTDPYRAVAD